LGRRMKSHGGGPMEEKEWVTKFVTGDFAHERI